MTWTITSEGAIILLGVIIGILGINILIAIRNFIEVNRIANDKTLTASEKIRRLQEEGFM